MYRKEHLCEEMEGIDGSINNNGPKVSEQKWISFGRRGRGGLFFLQQREADEIDGTLEFHFFRMKQSTGREDTKGGISTDEIMWAPPSCQQR